MVKANLAVKEEEVVQQKEPKAVALVGDEALPAHLLAALEQHAGLGNAHEAADNTPPFLKILQAGSPEVKEEDGKYIEGAKPGFILNTSAQLLYPARISKQEPGIRGIAVGQQRNWVEWKPNRGGFEATHPFDIPLVRKMGAKKVIRQVEGKDREFIELPNGNILQETVYVFFLLDGLVPAVIPAASSALGPIQQWNNYRKAQRAPGSGRELPSYGTWYRLQTAVQTKDTNSWHNWKYKDEGLVKEIANFNLAQDFAIAVAKGEVKLGRPDYFDDADTSSADDGIDV